MPPWPCTIALGLPVVPEENSTCSGWSNGTGSNAGGVVPDEQVRPGHRVRQRIAGRTAPGRRGDRRQAAADLGDLGGAVDVLVPVDVARRRRAAPSARPGRTGRRRCGRRTPARSTPRSRRGSRWRGTRPGSRGCSAGTRRRGRRGPTPSRASPARARATWSRSSAQVSSTRSRVCEYASTATSSSREVSASRCAGVVEPGALEPARARHRLVGEHRRVGRVRHDPEVLPIADQKPSRSVTDHCQRSSQPSNCRPRAVSRNCTKAPAGGRPPVLARAPEDLTLLHRSARCGHLPSSPARATFLGAARRGTRSCAPSPRRCRRRPRPSAPRAGSPGSGGRRRCGAAPGARRSCVTGALAAMLCASSRAVAKPSPAPTR